MDTDCVHHLSYVQHLGSRMQYVHYATEVNRVITCSSVCPSQAVNSLCTYVTMSVSKSRVSLLLSVTFNVM